MTSTLVNDTGNDTAELLRVLVWRFRQLCATGFEVELAATLACRVDIDLHRATGLVERGCPPETAGRILL